MAVHRGLLETRNLMNLLFKVEYKTEEWSVNRNEKFPGSDVVSLRGYFFGEAKQNLKIDDGFMKIVRAICSCDIESDQMPDFVKSLPRNYQYMGNDMFWAYPFYGQKPAIVRGSSTPHMEAILACSHGEDAQNLAVVLNAFYRNLHHV